MNTTLSEWLQLPDTNKRNIFAETARRKALPVSSVEKDWWVVHTLSALFSTENADKYLIARVFNANKNPSVEFVKLKIDKVTD